MAIPDLVRWVRKRFEEENPLSDMVDLMLLQEVHAKKEVLVKVPTHECVEDTTIVTKRHGQLRYSLQEQRCYRHESWCPNSIPTKKNTARKERSIAELGPRRQPSSMEQEISFRDLSNTEEKFFDSIQWLESDSEDFFSVNGAWFHPYSTFSCGNNPKNLKTLKENSPTNIKNQLIELFRESSNDYDDDDAVNNYPNMKDELEDKAAMLNKLPKSRSKSPHESISNSVGSNEARCFPGEEKPAHET
ncbi:hypothetical protein Gogos_006555 [Gossypium gossypioides]|uniref:Uncharacterized protein n=1 Tax=Gossypium gossypioides TaxID=34282 RepID=A0A7J9C6D5_GOSGO|nr:hypothetical protein [Gossypium gossypioides]